MAASELHDISGKRFFVFGDIHGCPDEPTLLTQHLEKECGLNSDDALIFLGDFVDRGPDTKGVVQLMLELKVKFPKTRFLKGNHEDMLLDFLGFGGRQGQAFLQNGGLETIQSYGISIFASPEEMVSSLPSDHFKFFCDLESMLRFDRYIAVHAGVNPLRDLNAQNSGDTLWIRDDFISNVHPFDFTILFGHTPHREVLLHLPYKIGLDTGLVFGNKLSCLELPSGNLYQVTRGAKTVVTAAIDLAAVASK